MRAKGFTLLEVILAVFILTAAVFGAFSLIQQTSIGASLSQSKLIAHYLGQEGIEVVRNMRDTNLLQGKNWKEGLGEGNWEADYRSQSLDSYGDRYLKIDPSGFYNYAAGAETNFKREIIIKEMGSNALEIKIIVVWTERGRAHSVEIINYLYDWYSG